jgi:Ras GTPase-activating-like protein IQGAP2/3
MVLYALLSILSQGPARDDPLRTILHELDGVPQLGSEELKDARDRAITLELTNRFAQVQGKDLTSNRTKYPNPVT